MHDIIHRELQKERVADLHRRAQQDRLGRDAADTLRRRAIDRVLAIMGTIRMSSAPADRLDRATCSSAERR